MSKYIQLTDEQRKTARLTDLVSFLRGRGETLTRSGSEFAWQSPSSKVTIRGNLWYHQYERVGGDAVEFVKRFYNKSYPETVIFLLEGGSYTLSNSPEQNILQTPMSFHIKQRLKNTQKSFQRRLFFQELMQQALDKTHTFMMRQKVFSPQQSYLLLSFVSPMKGTLFRYSNWFRSFCLLRMTRVRISFRRL